MNNAFDILVAILTGAFCTNRALTRPLREIWTGTLYMNMLKELNHKSKVAFLHLTNGLTD